MVTGFIWPLWRREKTYTFVLCLSRKSSQHFCPTLVPQLEENVSRDHLSSSLSSLFLGGGLTTVTTIWPPHMQTPAKPVLKRLRGRFVWFWTLCTTDEKRLHKAGWPCVSGNSDQTTTSNWAMIHCFLDNRAQQGANANKLSSFMQRVYGWENPFFRVGSRYLEVLFWRILTTSLRLFP